MSRAAISADTHNALIVEFEAELNAIARWWLDIAFDERNGGLIGEIGIDNSPGTPANKGAIYHSRALWFFSELSRTGGRREHYEAAERLYRYIETAFWDSEYGGVYWSLDCDGRPVESRKHIYAQSFCIYGLSAYYHMSADRRALARAAELYELIEQYGCDARNGGYFEGFTRGWERIGDMRLSAKEPDAPKTMNTHLHVLEAYTALYKASGEAGVAQSLRRIIECCARNIIDPDSRHLRVFMEDDWRDLSMTWSYGHEIECSWLLWEAMEALGGHGTPVSTREQVVALAEGCLNEGWSPDGYLLDSRDKATGRAEPECPWWVQAEALVGFLNAYQMTGNIAFYKAFTDTWSFIKQHHIDRERGEWYMHSFAERVGPEQENYKAGFWKAPYHNGRAMMEVCSRLRRLQSEVL